MLVNKILVRKNFGSEKMLGPTKFGVKKKLESEKNMENIFGPKKILGQK